MDRQARSKSSKQHWGSVEEFKEQMIIPLWHHWNVLPTFHSTDHGLCPDQIRIPFILNNRPINVLITNKFLTNLESHTLEYIHSIGQIFPNQHLYLFNHEAIARINMIDEDMHFLTIMNLKHMSTLDISCHCIFNLIIKYFVFSSVKHYYFSHIYCCILHLVYQIARPISRLLVIRRKV